jgi:hypothetical protein
MATIPVNAKRRGRPKTTGEGHLVGVRILPNLMAALESWIARQPDPKPSRPEAIRRLLAERLAQGRTSKSIKVQDLTSQNDT